MKSVLSEEVSRLRAELEKYRGVVDFQARLLGALDIPHSMRDRWHKGMTMARELLDDTDLRQSPSQDRGEKPQDHGGRV